jgi:hypothetical protein
MWWYVKHVVCAQKIRDHVTGEKDFYSKNHNGQARSTWDETEYRLGVFMATNGTHIKIH